MLTPSHGGNVRAMAALAGHDPAHADKLLDFSVNVRPTGPPDFVLAALWRAMNDITAYPAPHAEQAVTAIAGHLGLAAENICPGNGSNALIHAIAPLLCAQCCAQPETDIRTTQVHILEPAFSEYAKAFAGFRLHHHIVPPHTQPDVEALLGDTNSIQGLFIAANPGNPSGSFVPPDVWVRLIRARPDIFFVLDEAFIDYVEHGSIIPLLRDHWPDNVLVLRSLTKFYAIPGVRVGYVVGPAPLLANLKAATPEWAMNTLALAAIHAVMKPLQDSKAENEVQRDARQTREDNARNREHLRALLDALPGVETVPSTANYVLFRVTGPSQIHTLAVRLARETGILLRDCANYAGLEGSATEHWFRAAVRLEADHERLAYGLQSILADVLQVPAQASAVYVTNKRTLTPALMIQGATSDAGKSVLAAAFCRIFLQDGFSVAPFKSQNMSLYGGTAGVDEHGHPLEMARAQIMQAQAAGLPPDVRMNPVMLKPDSNTGSHVVVLGKHTGHMDARTYMNARQSLWPCITKTYDDLAAEHDVMVLEGAGSPAEINLKHGDVVNMAMARHAQAKVILAGDIDRGGLYAAFLGTFLTFTPEERNLLHGFVVNRFRGDESLLAPAHDWLMQRTGKPVLGVVAHISNLGLPEEDSLSGVGNTGATLSGDDVNRALDRVADVVRRSIDMQGLYAALGLTPHKK